MGVDRFGAHQVRPEADRDRPLEGDLTVPDRHLDTDHHDATREGAPFLFPFPHSLVVPMSLTASPPPHAQFNPVAHPMHF